MRDQINKCVYLTLLFFCPLFCYGQNDGYSDLMSNYEKELTSIESEEKEDLKEKVLEINEQLQNGAISDQEADDKKKELALLHARNMNDRKEIIQRKIDILKRNRDEQSPSVRTEKNMEYNFRFSSHNDRKGNRHQTRFLFAFGLNNVANGMNINNTPYDVSSSNFYEVGLVGLTALTNNDVLRLGYGITFQFNKLKPKKNAYHEVENDLVRLVEVEQNLKKSKFRTDNLVFPLFLELRPFNSGFKIGVGGHVGINIGTRQKIIIEEQDAEIRIQNGSSIPTNEFIYGFNGYVGFGSTSLYLKYDANELFPSDPAVHNVSMGIRFDW